MTVLDTVLETARGTLHDEELGEQNNFFEAGGDSLAVIEFCSQLETALGIEVPMQLVWDATTMAEVAALVEALPAAGSPS